MPVMTVDADKLEIVFYPAPVLRKKAAAVSKVNDEVRAIAMRMIELMRQADGVGLAAPQVGLAMRLFVANETGNPQDDRIFINPVLSNPSQEVEPLEEGCLSIPTVRGEVRRPRQITVTAMDLNGDEFQLTSDGLPARIWQHENDHLDGILIIDRMSPVDKVASRRKLRDLEAQYSDR